jgi:ZIP family zinc transporter
MVPILLSLATFLSTGLGGLFCIKERERLHLVMGFTAGVLLGVVAFDILPEIVNQVAGTGAAATHAMVALVTGFLLFHIGEKAIVIHHAHEGDYADHSHPQVGVLAALGLAAHSFLDGLGIGLGFQVNPKVGLFVAIAVIAHDFTDGMNTVALMLAHKNSIARARWFLLVDAIAPVLGAASTLWLRLPEGALALYLGFLAGFLLYIGASDILPQAHSRHSSWKTIALTVAGTAFIFLVTRFV